MPTQPKYMPPKLASVKPAPKPVARGQDDGLRIPTPADLGLAPTADSIERNLEAAGVRDFRFDRDGDGFLFVGQTPRGELVGRGKSREAALHDALRR